MQSQWWKRFWLHRRQGLSVCLSLCLSTSVCLCLYHSDHNAQLHSVSQKSPPPEVMLFFNFFHKRLRIFNRFLHTYYTFVSSIDYRFFIQLYPRRLYNLYCVGGDVKPCSMFPRLWNSLPARIRQPDNDIGEFRRQLKSFLFKWHRDA